METEKDDLKKNVESEKEKNGREFYNRVFQTENSNVFKSIDRNRVTGDKREIAMRAQVDRRIEKSIKGDT